MVVLAGDDPDFRAVADEIADRRGEGVVTDLDAVGEGRVVYVAAPDEIADRTVLALQRRLSASGPTAGGFGIVTGHTAEKALALYERDRPDDGTHVVANKLPAEHELTDDDAVLYERDELTVEDIREHTADRSASLALGASGWSIHVNLADGYICGFPEEVDPSTYSSRQPYCVSDGELSCPLDGDLVRAQELDVNHVLTTSCTPMLDNNLTGLPVHVGMGLLDTVESLVGSYRVRFTAFHELAFHYCLLRAGYDLAERCYLLNRGAKAAGYEAYPYVPFGRPESTLADPTPPEYDLTVERDGDDARIVVENVDAHVVDATVPPETLRTETGEFYLRDRRETTESPLRYAAFPEDDGVRILTYGTGAIPADSLDLRLSDRPARATDREVVRDYLRNAERHLALGVFGEKGRRQTESFRDRVHSFADLFSRERVDPNAHREIATRIDETLKAGRSLQGRLAERYESADKPAVVYAERVRDVEMFVSDIDCHRCGRPVFLKEYETAAGGVRRAIGVCPTDGIVLDVPTDGGDRAPTHPRIPGDHVAETGDERTVEVAFTNPRDHPVEAAFEPSLPYYSGDGEELFAPASVETDLGPGEETRVEFTLDAGPIHPNQHRINVHVFADLELYAARTSLLVGDRSGWRPHVG